MHELNMRLRRLAGVAVLFALLAPCTVFAQDAAQPASASPTAGELNPLGLTMTRRHSPTFEPGKPFEVAVTIDAAATGQITAMGLRETLPPEWRLESVAGTSGGPPDVSPEPGAMGLLEFAWITIPKFPCTFTYVVTPPEVDGGMKTIHGALEYREMGGAHQAAPVITDVRGPSPKQPTITLKGNNPATVSVGDTWQEPGYTAVDGNDHDVTGKVVVTGTVDTTAAAEYLIDYVLTLDDGRKAATARSVVVKAADGKQTTPAAGGAGAAAPTQPGPSGRELSNPIAASADKNPANQAQDATTPAAPGAEGEAAIKKPELPDLSAFRPAPAPQPGDTPPAQPDAAVSAPAATANPAAETPAASVPAIQHRAPVPKEMLKSAAVKEPEKKDAGPVPPAAAAKSPLSSLPEGSLQIIVVVAVALALLGGLGLLGWLFVYNRPVRRKRPPSPPTR